MSNILTQTMAFKKESISEFFTDPFFMGEDIRQMVTVRTDIKGTEKLNRISHPSKITRKKTVPGFTPIGALNLTQTEITVKPVAVEFEQNARSFLGSVVEGLTAKGMDLDDVGKMGSGFWNEIVLPIIAEAGKADLVRQMFFADEKKETLAAGIATGTIDQDYNVYTGFWSRFINNIRVGSLPAAQRVTINNGAVKQEEVQTLAGITGGTISINVSGKILTQAFDTSAAVTVANWVATHAATLIDRGELAGIVATNPSSGAVKFVATHPGQAFTITIVSAGTGGTFTQSGVVANVAHAALGADEADGTFENMINVIPDEMRGFSDLVFMASNSMVRNFIKTLKNTGTEAAHSVKLGGQSVLSYEGFPIINRPDWDRWISADMASVYPHRAILTTPKNLLFGTDGAGDDEAVETWYNLEAQMHRYRVQYMAQTQHLHNSLIVLAY